VEDVDQALKAAYRTCTRLTRQEAKNFYFAFLTLPRKKRRAIYAVYAFCREADDIADREGKIGEKKAELKRLRDRLRQAASGEPQCFTDLALCDVIARFSIDPVDLAHVIDGVEMDLTVSRYANFEELRRYCRLVASAPGLAVLPILARGRKVDAITEEDRERATALGIGMQLANIVRDIAEDLTRDRVYLPQEDLERFGVCEQNLRKSKVSEALRALVAFESTRAREYLREGEKLLTRLPRRSRGCPALLAALYSRILDKIRNKSYDVLASRVSLSTCEKVWLMLRTWAKALLR
jgi:phytoene synthase